MGQKCPCSRHKGVLASGVIFTLFINFGIRWSELSASHSSRLNLRETATDKYWIEDCEGSIVDLDAVEKRKISCLCQVSNHLSPIFQSLACPLYQLR